MPREARIPPSTGDGWQGLEPEDAVETKQRNAEEADRQAEFNDKIRATFSTPAGKEVWEWLWKSTILNEPSAHLLGVDRGAPVAFHESGQRALVLNLWKRMKPKDE